MLKQNTITMPTNAIANNAKRSSVLRFSLKRWWPSVDVSPGSLPLSSMGGGTGDGRVRARTELRAETPRLGLGELAMLARTAAGTGKRRGA